MEEKGPSREGPREGTGEDKGAGARAPAAANEEEREGGLLPAILVGLGLLAVVGLLVFGGSDGDDAKADGAKSAAADGAGKAAGGAAGRAGEGGVPARPYDKASAAPVGSARINPAVRLPAVGMAPQGSEGTRRDDKPPEDATEEELITWYEKQLEEAQRNLERRKVFKGRLPGIRQRIEESNHPQKDKELESFETRAKVVSDNLDRAQAKVDEIEKKLAELRGS